MSNNLNTGKTEEASSHVKPMKPAISDLQLAAIDIIFKQMLKPRTVSANAVRQPNSPRSDVEVTKVKRCGKAAFTETLADEIVFELNPPSAIKSNT